MTNSWKICKNFPKGPCQTLPRRITKTRMRLHLIKDDLTAALSTLDGAVMSAFVRARKP